MCIAFSMLMIIPSVRAEEPGQLANTSAVQETQNVEVMLKDFPAEILERSMQQSLAKKGLALNTINDDGSIDVIGAATTMKPSNSHNFIQSRNNAYYSAELIAKMRLLQLACEQITSGRGYSLLDEISEGEDPDLAKAAKDIAKEKPQAKKVTHSEQFNMAVRSVAAGMIKGCAVVRICEGENGNDDYQVAVCLKYSPEFQRLAGQIMSNAAYQIPVGEVKDSHAKVMGWEIDELINRLGVFVSFNKKGQMVIYGFGQAEIKETNSRGSNATQMAYSKSRLQAVNNIKNFVAEDLVANEMIENVEKLIQYSDKSEEYYMRDKLMQSIQSKATTLNISTQTIKTWKGIHPTSGLPVAGTIVAWTYEHAVKAKQLNEEFKKRGSSVGIPSAPQHQKTTEGKITITGDDEDL